MGPADDLDRAAIRRLGLRDPLQRGFVEMERFFAADMGWNALEEIDRAGLGTSFG